MSAFTDSSQPSNLIARQMRQRRIVDQIGRLTLILLLILGGLLYLYIPFQTLAWMNTPFVGSFLEYPLNVNAAISQSVMRNGQGSTGADQLQANDSILAVDGQPVSSARDLQAILRTHHAGDSVTLDVLSEDGQSRQVNVTLTKIGVKPVLILFGIPYLIGLVYLAIGLWVYRNRRDQPIGRAFLVFTSSMALLLVTVFDLWTTHTFVRLLAAAIPWAGATLVTFALFFPSESALAARRPAIREIPNALALLLITLTQVQIGQSHEVFIRWMNYEYIFAGVSILIFILAMLAQAISAASPSSREQCRVILAGAAVAFAPFVIDLAFSVVNIQISWVMLASIVFPLAIAYSIVQYSMLDTGRALSFTGTYTIMAAVVIFGYALVVTGINTLAAQMALNQISPTNPVLVGLLTFILVLVFQPVRAQLQQRIDQFFFRTRSEYQQRLTSFRHDLTLASGLNDVVRLLKQQIRESLLPTHVYVFLRDPQTNTFIAIGEGRRPDTDIRFDSQSGLVHALSTARELIFLEFNKPLPPELVNEHARLAVLRTPILAPLQGQERLAGWVAVGNKRSDEAYTIHDLRFIQALTEQASVAVERAQAIGDLERRVRELDVLSQVSQAVNFTTDTDVLLELIYTQTSKLIDTTNFYIVMHDQERQELSYAFFLEGDERLNDREGISWPDTEGLEAEVVRVGRPIRTTDYALESRQRGLRPRVSRLQAWMGVPLNAGTTTLGAMIVASYIPGVVFTEEQLKVFWAIADQAATALDKARLFNETETRARQLATLNEISKELSSTLDLENLLTRIMASAVDILNTEAGTLYLVDSNELVFRVVWGGAQDLVGTRMPISKGIAGQAATTGSPAVSNDVLRDQRWFSEVDRETAFQTQSLLAVPLLILDETIGVLQVINKRDGTNFGDEDIALLTTFAGQAAVAIDNARLYEATDAELADRVDELQNLQRIDRELNRTLDFDRVVQITIDWAQRITGASAVALAMKDPETERIDVLAASGYDSRFLERYQETGLPLDTGIVGRVLTSGKAEFVRDVRSDPDFIPATGEIVTSQITVPILRVNNPIGVLVLESEVEDLFDGKDFEFSQRLVEHAAVAIENARLVKEIEDANRSKSEFISLVSHELKNPMTSIRGYTDLLKSGQTGEINDMQTQFLSTIRTNVDRMTRLVSDLSDSARIETQRMRLDMAPITVGEVIEETLRAFQGQIEEKEQELSLQIEDDLPMIYADHTRMVQVMTNLVSNAYKYTPEKGKLTIGARKETVTDEESDTSKDIIHHWVTDTGIGMSEDEMEQLFTKFYRTQRGKDMAQGTGLGLNITKSLIEMHGGTIWVESQVGKGTTFHYSIPVYTEEQEAEARRAVGE